MRVELHPDARAELRSAALWYDEQRDGLVAEFLTEVAAALDRISRTPESSPLWTGLAGRTSAIRRHTLHRFPYVVPSNSIASVRAKRTKGRRGGSGSRCWSIGQSTDEHGSR